MGLTPVQNRRNLYVASLFSRLNRIPDEDNSYLRPQHIQLNESEKGLDGRVLKCQFRIFHNLLTVRLENSNYDWSVLDSKREFKVGDFVKLTYNRDNVLHIGED
jgi:hypothetical protein